MAEPPDTTPQTTDLMLSSFAGLYRQEVAAEEDIHRTLPFFTTALGIVVGALGFAAGQVPPLPAMSNRSGIVLFAACAGLLLLSVGEAVLVLYWLLRAVARREHRRIGPEVLLRNELDKRRAAHLAAGLTPHRMDALLLHEMRQFLLQSYREVTPGNRAINRDRHLSRGNAAKHLIRALGWALIASVTIFVAGKV